MPSENDHPPPLVTEPIRLVLTAKLLFWILTLLATGYMHMPYFQRNAPVWHPPPAFDIPDLSHRLSSWDAGAYLEIARNGYRDNPQVMAFYPLLPMLLFPLVKLFPSHLVFAASCLISLISLLGCLQFYKLVHRITNREIARDSLIVLLCLPGSIYLELIYTESLFLLLVTSLFIWSYSRRWGGVMLCAFSLPLCRPTGVVVLMPLLAFWILERDWRFGCACVATVAGYIIHFMVMDVFADDPFASFHAQAHYPNSPSIGNAMNIAQILSEFANIQSIISMKYALIDRFYFVLFLLAMPIAWRLGPAIFAYYLCAGLLPAATSWFISYTRYFILIFPAVIAVAFYLRWLGQYARLTILGLFLSLKVTYLVRFLSHAWAN